MSDSNWPPPGPTGPQPPPAGQPPIGQPPAGQPWAGQPVPPSPGGAPYGQPPAAPPAKRSSLWKILLGVFIAAVVLIGGCSFVLFRAVSGPIDLSNEFLAEVAADDFDAAFDRLDSRCFEDVDRDELRAFLDPVASYDLRSASVTNTTGINTGEVTGSATFDDGQDYAVTFELVDRGQGWAICSVSIQ
jgi:hypothetical protein